MALSPTSLFPGAPDAALALSGADRPPMASLLTGSAGLSHALHAPASASRASLARTARDFEALTIGQLLAPMFNTVDTADGLFGGGHAEAAWKPMLVDAIARKVADRGGLGLAGPVFRELLHAQETHAEGTRSSKGARP